MHAAFMVAFIINPLGFSFCFNVGAAYISNGVPIYISNLTYSMHTRRTAKKYYDKKDSAENPPDVKPREKKLKKEKKDKTEKTSKKNKK